MLQQGSYLPLLDQWVLAGAVQHEDPTELCRLLLGAENDLTGVRRCHDPVAQQRDGLGPLPAQPAGKTVGRVPEPCGCLLDASARLVSDPSRLHSIQHVGDRRHRDTGAGRDVPDRGLRGLHKVTLFRSRMSARRDAPGVDETKRFGKIVVLGRHGQGPDAPGEAPPPASARPDALVVAALRNWPDPLHGVMRSSRNAAARPTGGPRRSPLDRTPSIVLDSVTQTTKPFGKSGTWTGVVERVHGVLSAL